MYLALYRKYRSKTFDEVISQEHITTTLKNQIKTGKLAHAYLFTGSRGTGKTTCAKLMARAVNCLSPVDGSPCGECEVCKAIADGCPDIIEMDAASNNGVDDVRALRDEVMYTPVLCRYKVYIIDEVHMMSGSAFNALLKTIEEPPAHVIFILATTEIQKVPATIVSRCQQFSFRRISVPNSTARLCEIAKSENVELEEPAAELISRLSDGGMRDAISLLDQCISVSRHIDEDIVRDTAGVAGTDHLFALADCVLNKNAAAALKILDELHDASKDLILLLEELTGHFRNLCMLSAMNMDFSLIPAGSGGRTELANQAGAFTLGEIMRCIDILQESIAKAPKSPRRKTLAEMCLVRLCTPRLDSDAEALSLRLERLEKKVDTLAGDTPKIMPRAAIPQPKIAEGPAEVVSDLPKIKSAEAKPLPQEKPVQSEQIIPQEKAQIQEEKPQKQDEQDNAPPSWLFEGSGGDTPPFDMPQDEDYPPFDTEQPVESGEHNGTAQSETAAQTEQSTPADEYDSEIPPFDLDEPAVESNKALPLQPTEPVPDIPPEPPLPQSDYSEPTPSVSQQGADMPSGTWAEIIDLLPMFLQPIIRQVTVRFTEDSILITDYQPFHYEFLKKGDSIDRIVSAAREVTGKNYHVLFDDAAQEKKAEVRDRVSAFINDAEKMGVKIKYKKKG